MFYFLLYYYYLGTTRTCHDCYPGEHVKGCHTPSSLSHAGLRKTAATTDKVPLRAAKQQTKHVMQVTQR